jgi:PhoH-like ATPase
LPDNQPSQPADHTEGGQASAGIKTFVLDTNVLLHNHTALTSFADNRVVIPIQVLEELDRFKTRNDELGRNARQVTRALDAVRGKGSLRTGVPLENGGDLRVLLPGEVNHKMPGLPMDASDNQILGVAYALSRSGERVIFVSKDINARVKADALGLVAEDFEKQVVDFGSFYAGWREVDVPAGLVDRFYAQKELSAGELPPGPQLNANEFVMLREVGNPKHSAVARHDHGSGKLVNLISEFSKVWNIAPRSIEQRMALEMLLDETVRLVTLVGRAGTGKTLLALAAGLELVLKTRTYEKMLVSRPIMPMGKDIGYLPGDKDEKLTNWMLPIFDNLKYLLSGRRRPVDTTVDALLRDGTVSLEALTYIRGRSISGQFLIVDEAQNLTPHEVKTIISRAGENTKLVLTGDPYQIDNPYLDSSSNGLVYAAEKLKDSPLTGHMVLTKSERSELASLAADKL